MRAEKHRELKPEKTLGRALAQGSGHCSGGQENPPKGGHTLLKYEMLRVKHKLSWQSGGQDCA